MMKKISSFLLVLFLVFFLWPSKAIAATGCCSGIYTYVDYSSSNSNLVGCCNTNLLDCSYSTLHFDNSKYLCGIHTCEASSQQCTSRLINIDPVCPSGYGIVNVLVAGCSGYDDKCCKRNSWNNCLNKNDPGEASIYYCSEIPGNAILVDKDACSDSTFRYNKDPRSPNFKKCEKFVESSWILNSTCDNNVKGVQTAIGCVPTTDLNEFLKFVLKWVFFSSGGIILLMVIATGYTIITSQGNPEKLQAAKENIVALLSGLAMIAFSLILLQVIGANILGLPTF